ncbi:hypothetical protein V8C86DRAFT_1815508 [Haematococcus lacustris]
MAMVTDDQAEVQTSLSSSSASSASNMALDSHSSGELFNSCWICLSGQSAARGELVEPCTCSRKAGRLCHTKCLARWQLQNAGTSRETQCQFCGEQLPDWRAPLTPPTGATGPAIMNVNHNGLTYSFHVEPGKEGYRKFTHDIRRAFNLPMDAELNITFTCDEPSTKDDPIASEGSLLTLQGPGAYDAAVHCASISAARRALTCGSTGSDLLGQPGAEQGAGHASNLGQRQLVYSPQSRRMERSSARARRQQLQQLQLLPSPQHLTRSASSVMGGDSGESSPASSQDSLAAGLGEGGGSSRGAAGDKSPRGLNSLGHRLRSALHDLFA